MSTGALVICSKCGGNLTNLEVERHKRLHNTHSVKNGDFVYCIACDTPDNAVSVKKSEREICLQQAIKYVTKDRNASYGEPENEFAIIAHLITPIIRDCVDPEDIELIVVKPHHVALILAQLKIARIIHQPGKFDSWVDGCGYLACGWDSVVGESK